MPHKHRRLWLGGIGLVALAVAIFIKATTFNPPSVEPARVACRGVAPKLHDRKQLTVMTWNIQYLAGKSYVFYYDLPDNSGPDVKPSRQAVNATFEEVMRVIRDVNPDILQLQEVNVGAKNTDYDDQLTRIFNALPDDYKCMASAWYWKSPFIPHPKILGAVGLKLATFSKFQIDSATRYQLAIPHPDLLTQMYSFRRAILESVLPIEGSAKPLYSMNTHLDAWAKGDDTMQKQVDLLRQLLDKRTAEKAPWLLSGDFNLLPPGIAYESMDPAQRVNYEPQTELAALYDHFLVVPTYGDVNGPERAKWFTQFPNDPKVKGPDRTIDYIFYSPLIDQIGHNVRQADTLKISDHEPVIMDAVVHLPKTQ